MESSCRICKNEYDEDKYKPFLLSCGDTLCQICINFYKESLGSEEFECPICCYPKAKSTNVSNKAAIKKKQISNINNNSLENDEFYIYIQTKWGCKFSLVVKKTMTINQIKEKIIEQEGCKFFDLAFKKPLYDGSKTLEFYGITKQVTISMITERAG